MSTPPPASTAATAATAAIAPPARTVHHADALAWLAERESLPGCSVVTSLPDVSELAGLDVPAWKRWFADAAALVLSRCPPLGVTIFFQTDIQHDGAWIDKGYLCSRAADDAGLTTLFHKVVCRKPPGTVAYKRHGYSHLLGFSRGVRHELARSTADVLPDAGPAPWTRGMGVHACAAACRYVLAHTTTRTIVDPFCGRGTALAVANALGLDAVGVELSARRARQARALTVVLAPGDGALTLVRGPRDAGDDKEHPQG